MTGHLNKDRLVWSVNLIGAPLPPREGSAMCYFEMTWVATAFDYTSAHLIAEAFGPTALALAGFCRKTSNV